MNILTAIHRLAEANSGDVKTLKGNAGENRLRVGDYRVRFTEEHPDSLRIHTVDKRKDAYRSTAALKAEMGCSWFLSRWCLADGPLRF